MHPILFETKFVTLHTIWLFFAIAIVAGTYAFIKLSIKNGLKLQFFSEISTRLILWTLIGARIVSVMFNYKTYFYEFSINTFLNLFTVWDKGLNIWGGIATFLVVFLIYCKKNEQDFWKWLDALIPSLIVGLAIGHIGTFFEGAAYGKPSNLPWAVNFESPSIKYAVPIHPTQVYAFLYSGIIAVALYMLNQNEKIKQIKKKGFVGILGIIAYSFLRFLEEFVRGDDIYLVFGIRFSQIAALLIFLSSGIFLYLRYNKRRAKR